MSRAALPLGGAVAVAVGWVVLAVATARRPATLLDRDAYFSRWAELHGGYDPRTGSRVVRAWLGGAYAAGCPLARAGVAPWVVTLLGPLLAGAACATAGAAPAAAALVLTGSGLLDNLDGAVAVLSGRDTRLGYVLDSAADRVSDVLALGALQQAGAPTRLCVAAGLAAFLLEYVRARAGAAGMDEVGVVTVAERPTRLVLAVVGLGLAQTGLLGLGWPALASAVTVLAGLAGLAQLSRAVRRALG